MGRKGNAAFIPATIRLGKSDFRIPGRTLLQSRWRALLYLRHGVRGLHNFGVFFRIIPWRFDIIPKMKHRWILGSMDESMGDGTCSKDHIQNTDRHLEPWQIGMVYGRLAFPKTVPLLFSFPLDLLKNEFRF